MYIYCYAEFYPKLKIDAVKVLLREAGTISVFKLYKPIYLPIIFISQFVYTPCLACPPVISYINYYFCS